MNANDEQPPTLPPRPSNVSNASSQGVSLVPPALPERAKSDTQVMLDLQKVPTAKGRSSNIDGHYAHLDKHLKEVRRKKKTAKVSKPVLSNFQKQDPPSTDWIHYIEAWIEYIISAAAYDEIDRPLEPFSLSSMKHDIDRLYPMVLPFIEPIKTIRPIYRWENKTLTGALAGGFLLLWYYDLILASLCFSFTVGILWIRVDMFAEYGVETLEQQPETEATVKPWDRGLWMKMKAKVKTAAGESSDIANETSITEWRNKIYTNYGPKLQLILSDTVDYIERIKNLITWKRPARTRFLSIIMGVCCLMLTIIPLRYVAKMIPLYFGFEFFVLQALRSHYPRHRRLFNLLNLLLWDIPNDAEYALEVVRLSQHVKIGKNELTPNPSPSSSSHSTESTSLRRRELHQKEGISSKKSFSSMSDISDNLLSTVAERVSKQQENTTIQEAITSNVKTFALLATATAVTKVKNAIDQRDAKGANEETQKGTTEQDDSNAFGCMYQGTIPGRILLQDDSFVFQTSRMTGGKVLVKYAYDDIIGVKKTKQYNVGFWHSNGLDVSLEDGTTLKFEHVLKRDNCFNALVSASNEEGSEWKKM